MFADLLFDDGNSAQDQFAKSFFLLRVELGQFFYLRPKKGKRVLDVLNIAKLSAFNHACMIWKNIIVTIPIER